MITRIEPVGGTLKGARSVNAHEKETDQCPKSELTGEMFCYKWKNTFMQKSSRRMER